MSDPGLAGHSPVIRLGRSGASGFGGGALRGFGGVLSLCAAFLAPVEVRAEEAELAVGLEGALILPALETGDRTAVSLATWGLGLYGRYGLLDDLDLSLRGSFAAFGGQVGTTMEVRGRAVVGNLGFDLQQWQFEAGARWKLFAGYNLAPYLEGHVGWMWSVYQDQRFMTPAGQDLGLELPNEGRGAFTVSAGLALDYRLMNLLFVGVAARWTEVFGDGPYRRYISAPIQVAFYW